MGRRASRTRRYTPEFKVEAVRLMHDRFAAGATLQRVSEELEVHPDQLRNWAKQMQAAPRGATPQEVFPGAGRRRSYDPELRPVAPPARNPEEELARLRRENERLRLERDFLKKAAAFFAKESQ
jgi:transposase-like protein